MLLSYIAQQQSDKLPKKPSLSKLGLREPNHTPPNNVMQTKEQRPTKWLVIEPLSATDEEKNVESFKQFFY